MPLDLDSIADVVATAIADALAPLRTQLAVAESRLLEFAETKAALQDLRDRVLVAETKAAILEQRPAPVLEAKSLELPPEILRRVEMLEQRPLPSELLPPVDLTPLQERLGKLEIKAAAPVELPEFITSGRLLMMTEKADRAVADVAELAKDFGALRERVAVVEVRQPMPGPAGKDGAAGRDGVDGLGWGDLQVVQGEDERTFTFQGERDGRVKTFGTFVIPVMIHRGTWADKAYARGDVVRWDGSAWLCKETGGAGRPGADGGKGWELIVKHGTNGRDGKDAVTIPVVTVGRS